MDTLTFSSSASYPSRFEPNIELIKRRLTSKGVNPSPKIVRILRKKEIQKHNRKVNKLILKKAEPPLTPSQKEALDDEHRFQTIRREYTNFTKALNNKTPLIGKPWEGVAKASLLESSLETQGVIRGTTLEKKSLKDLKELLQEDLKWILDEDIESETDVLSQDEQSVWDPEKRKQNTKEAIRYLVEKLCARDIIVKDWKLTKVIKLSGLRLTEANLLKIIEGLGNKHKWAQALAIVDWAYTVNTHKESKSRLVFKKLVTILAKEGRPNEALRIFNTMRESPTTYPDTTSYHSIAVTLGKAGLVKELIQVIKTMDSEHEAHDLVMYNSVLNACVTSKWWKVSMWVFDQIRKKGIHPNAATYGLAMEVMLESGKHELTHKIYEKMIQSGVIPTALTYRVLVKTFCEEMKINEAVETVREMEKRGVLGIVSVYYELSCFLCEAGRFNEAINEIKNLKGLHMSKPLEIFFSGMIQSAMAGGHFEHCKSLFSLMKQSCSPNIGTLNTMIKLHSKTNTFSEAKALYEEASDSRDEYTYNAMLEAAAAALEWDCFENVYKQMVINGYNCKKPHVLVRASENGKGHVVEHAFESALERGEIPELSLFLEMLVGAIERREYEKVVALVDCMGCASFCVSTKKWMDLLRMQKKRIGENGVLMLLRGVAGAGFSSEPTFRNLSAALLSLRR